MKRAVIFILVLAFALPSAFRASALRSSAASPFLSEAVPDSAVLRSLDARLDEYFNALEAEPLDVKMKECDFIIQNTSDSLLRQYVTIRIYDHYLESPVMGDEAVAIHITDSWFTPGKVRMQTEAEEMNARVYADFNRQSLLGCRAPELVMFSQDSAKVNVRFNRYTVLYFYDTECSKCKLESLFLKPLLERKNYPVDFYAIYAGVDKESWLGWKDSRFNVNAENTRIIHLWDPEVESDFQMKYGVLSTPKTFLVAPGGKIVGRGMDHRALEQLLDLYLSMENYEYGGDETAALFNELFKSYGDTLKAEDIVHTAELLENRTLDKGDTLFFKHMEGDLLYYLSNHKGEEYNAGALLFVEDYILGRPDIWSTSDDSLKVVGLAQMMHELLSRNPVGSRLPVNMPFKGWKKFLKKGGYLVFHTEGCHFCEEELHAFRSLMDTLPKKKQERMFEVNTTAVFDAEPDCMTQVMDAFDLSSMPHIMKIAPGGVVERKYITFLK